MKVEPFHSKLQTSVYHDESKCEVGDNIESWNKVKGTGGLRKCDECTRISG